MKDGMIAFLIGTTIIGVIIIIVMKKCRLAAFGARRIFVTKALMELSKKDALKMSEELEVVRGVKAETVGQVENISYRELMSLVTSLPPGFRTVFNLYAIEGYSHKEISQMLEITETTSRTQLRRARLWLQDKIKSLKDAGKQ